MLWRMADDVLQPLQRYAAQLRASLGTAPAAPNFKRETGTSMQVGRAAILAQAVSGGPTTAAAGLVDRPLELASSVLHRDLSFIDDAGHSRAAYRPAFVYALLQTYKLWYESLSPGDFGRWEEALRVWADLLEDDLGSTTWPGTVLPASAGDRWAEMAWDALALHVAGKIFVRDAWTDLASDTFGRLTRAQQASGAFLTATASDQPETMWYHELQILHAAASFAVQAEDRNTAAAVARAGVFHQNETQPDHATTQPWGLFAFIWNPETRMLADQVLHAAALQQPGAIDGLSLMLLADSLYCLKLFEG